jgi:hypothetical protein
MEPKNKRPSLRRPRPTNWMGDWVDDPSEIARLERLQLNLIDGSGGVMEKLSHLPHVDLSEMQW